MLEDLLIIFDTNAVNLLRPEGPTADIIRKLRQSGHHRVAVPWMVLEEMAAHEARYYPRKYQTALESLAKLQADLPWELKSSLEPLDLERLLEHWRGAYEEIFEVIETSGAALRRAYQREAMALPPAKPVKDHAEGGRDAAIWFSILDFLKQYPDEHVYFVTNNTKDFGDGSSYKYPMNEDIRGLEDRLTMLKDFAQVVSEFTTEVSGKEAEDAAARLLASPAVRDGIAESARGLSTLNGYDGLGDGGASERWFAWSGTPDVELLSLAGVTGHAIEGEVWYTATAKWLVYGPAVDEVEASLGHIACVWETRILFSAGDGMDPTLLTPGEPTPPDTSDESCMKILGELKKRVADMAAAARRKALGRTPAEQLLSNRIAATFADIDLVSNARIARQAAEQAALVSGPAQRLARQAAVQLGLIEGPMRQIARRMAADRAAIDAAINAPALRHVQQAAQQAAEQVAALPRLDIPGYTHQPPSGGDVPEDSAEQDEQPEAESKGAGRGNHRGQ
jgi:hypothetical protein